MSVENINLTAPIHAATKQGKAVAAREVFMDGDKETVQQIGEKTHQLEDAIKDITATGGASTANAVSYSNSTSGMTAVTAQGAIDELASKKANSADVTSQMQTEQTRVNAELEKKFNLANITQESGDAEDKVMSQKAVNTKFSDLSTNEGISDIGLTSDDAQELDYCLDSRGILGRKFQNAFIPVRINQDRDAQNGIILDRQKVTIIGNGYKLEGQTVAVKKIFEESRIYVSVGDIDYPESQSDKPFVLIRFIGKNENRVSQNFIYANSNEEIDIPKDAYIVQVMYYLSLSGTVKQAKYVFNKVHIVTNYLNRYLNKEVLLHSKDIQTLPNIGKIFFDDDDIVYVGTGKTYDAAFFTEIPANKKNGNFHIKIGNVEIPDKGKQEEVCVVFREKNSDGIVITNNLYYEGNDVIIIPNINTAKIILIVYVSTANVSVKNETYKIHNLTIAYEGKYNVLALKNKPDTTKDWENATLATYGDSITAICNGDFSSPFNVLDTNIWGNRVANYYNMSKQLGRGIGSQGFMWRGNGGAICFINADTGTLIERMQNYNYDTWMALEEKDFYDSVRHIDLSSKVSKEQIDNGVIIPIRGCFCSWLRIKTMFPKSIKDDVNLIFIMGGTNDMHEDTKATWIANDETDPEWKNSEYYSTYGGDYNISTIKGGIASTIMKIQAWMPNAIIVLGTNLNGRSADKTLSVDETNKAKDMIEVAQLLGIPCIDIFGTAGINGLNSLRFITDGIHPYSVLGSKYLARSIIGGLKSIIPNL